MRASALAPGQAPAAQRCVLARRALPGQAPAAQRCARGRKRTFSKDSSSVVPTPLPPGVLRLPRLAAPPALVGVRAHARRPS
eukprot:2080731-Alexandrium_andersonii.AAC.1